MNTTTEKTKDQLLVNFSQRKKNIDKKNFLKKIADVGVKTELCLTTFGQLAQAIIGHQIVGNDHNRGLGVVNRTRVEAIVEDFYPDGFGQITLVDNLDDTYILSDGHHRSTAVVELFNRDMLSKYRDLQISVEVTSKRDGLKNYATKGSAKGHGLSAKITDPRLGVGDMINTFVSKTKSTPYRGITFVNKKLYPQLAYAIYVASTLHKDKELNFQEMLKEGSTAIRSLANLLPDELEFSLASHKEKQLVSAINYVVDVFSELVRLNDINKGTQLKAQLSAGASNLVNSSTLFIWLVWDKYSGRENVTVLDAKTVAQKITAQLSDSVVANSLICAKRYTEGTQKMFEIIRTKKKDVFNFA